MTATGAGAGSAMHGMPSLVVASARTTLRNRDLARLLLSWGGWVAADWAYLIVLSVVAYEAGGAAAVGLVGAMRVLPAALLGSLASLAVDRLPRARVLATVHASLALIMLALTWLTAATAPLTVLLVVVAVGSALSSVFKPCVQSLLPQLVRSPGELVAANSAFSTVEATATVAGPVLSGVLLAVLPAPVTFAVLAVLLAGSAVASLGIHTDFQPARSRRATGLRALVEPLRGFPSLTARTDVRVLFSLFVAQSCMRGFLNVFVVVLALRNPGGLSAGALFAAIGAGGVIGAIGALGAGGTDESARRFGAGVMLWGLPVLAIGLWPQPVVTWVALAVLGLGNAVEDVYGYSILNRLLPDEVAGRAWGAFHSAVAGALAVGSLAAPLLISAVGLQAAMVISGAVLAALPVLALRQLRKLDAAGSADPGQVELLRGVAALAPLPPLALERLALLLREIDVPAGATPVRQGDIGDAFYVVEAGQLSVHQDGRELRTLGRGDSFGEVALLLTVARTATVTASGPCRLLMIGRDSFVAAVTGHRGAEQAAGETVQRFVDRDAARVVPGPTDPPTGPGPGS